MLAAVKLDVCAGHRMGNYVNKLIVIVALLLLLGALAYANASVSAAPPDVENCEPWRKAGQWTLYKCAGEDWTEPTCVHSDSGMMYCRWED